MSGTWPDNDMSGKLGQQNMIKEYTLTVSDHITKTTCKLMTDFWDYKLIFNCPNCGLTWHTKEYSSLLDQRPTECHLNCHSGRNGCGNRCKITFHWRA